MRSVTRLIARLARSWRMRTLIGGCAAAAFGIALYRWCELRPVIRSVNDVGGILVVRGSQGFPREIDRWIAVDNDVERIRIELCRLPPDLVNHLPALPDLVEIGLLRCTFNDADLDALGRKQGLTQLWFSGCNVTDGGLQRLAGLKSLRELGLTGAAVSDAGLEALTALPGLERLALAESPVGDAGLCHVGALTSLKNLNLARTRITDAGLADLQGLSNLELLILSQTAVTSAGAAALKKSLPRCTIVGP